MIKFSGHNIFSKIKDSENYFIVNLLSGNADILTSVEAERIESLRKNAIEYNVIDKELIEKGYFAEELKEKELYKNKYFDFIDSRDDDEIQIFFVLNYSCNFSCTYCYQDQYENTETESTREIIDSFFNFIKIKICRQKKISDSFWRRTFIIKSQSKKKK